MIYGFDLFILSIEMQILLIGLFTTADRRKYIFLQSISQSNTNGWSKKYKTKKYNCRLILFLHKNAIKNSLHCVYYIFKRFLEPFLHFELSYKKSKQSSCYPSTRHLSNPDSLALDGLWDRCMIWEIIGSLLFFFHCALLLLMALFFKGFLLADFFVSSTLLIFALTFWICSQRFIPLDVELSNTRLIKEYRSFGGFDDFRRR